MSSFLQDMKKPTINFIEMARKNRLFEYEVFHKFRVTWPRPETKNQNQAPMFDDDDDVFNGILLWYENARRIILSFQIVEPTNIALCKFASMKSVYTPENPAGRAVDGNPADPMAHSLTDLPIWFYVDLGQTARVYNISILNREGQCKKTFTLSADLE